MSPPNFEYSVAISYASEQGDYVTEFNEHIRKKGFTSFLDREKRAQLWGEYLPEALYDVYSKKSKWCVMFISSEYVSKVYPNLERKAIIDRQLRSERYVLPVRFDDSEVPGLSVGISYVLAEDYSPSELADLFEEKYFS